MIKACLIFIIMFIFIGCTNKVDITKENLQYPNWYMTPPQNTDINLYGVGMGFSHNEAIQNALENLSSRLLVTISSDITISSKSYRDFREYTQKTVTQDIKSEIEKLSLQNYIIEDSSLFDRQIIVLVSINKSKLFDSLKKEIDFLYKEFYLLKSQSIDSLILYIKYKKLLEIFYKNYNKAQILSSFLNDNDKYIKVIEELKILESNLQNDMEFFISSDNNSKKFEDTLKDILVREGFKVVEANIKNKNIYELNLSSKSSESKSYGLYIIENILNIKIINSKNNQILSNTIQLKGASSNNFDDARLNLLQKLQKEKEEVSILPF
ncbi:LPP20 family lipoprotein [Aliarcobacter lanthieri]|uniref:LPP20 family lipoprotein n=1 Tax=Aliarcobacter lanthieri TaxID=1355374 RepID=UPI003AFAB6F0